MSKSSPPGIDGRAALMVAGLRGFLVAGMAVVTLTAAAGCSTGTTTTGSGAETSGGQPTFDPCTQLSEEALRAIDVDPASRLEFRPPPLDQQPVDSYVISSCEWSAPSREFAVSIGWDPRAVETGRILAADATPREISIGMRPGLVYGPFNRPTSLPPEVVVVPPQGGRALPPDEAPPPGAQITMVPVCNVDTVVLSGVLSLSFSRPESAVGQNRNRCDGFVEVAQKLEAYLPAEQASTETLVRDGAGVEPVFNPCTDLGDDVLRTIGVDPASKLGHWPPNGTAPPFCQWFSPTGSHSVAITWLTADPPTDPGPTTGVPVGDRTGMLRRDRDPADYRCTVRIPAQAGDVAVEFVGGAQYPMQLDPCDAAVQRAEQLEPHLPQ